MALRWIFFEAVLFKLSQYVASFFTPTDILCLLFFQTILNVNRFDRGKMLCRKHWKMCMWMDETIERFDVVKCFKVPVISSIIVLEISVTIILIGVHGPPVMSFVFYCFFLLFWKLFILYWFLWLSLQISHLFTRFVLVLLLCVVLCSLELCCVQAHWNCVQEN